MINDYQELTEHAQSTISNQKNIDLVYIIFLNTYKYNRALLKWNEKPTHRRTWDNFKIHINEAFDINQEFDTATATEAGFTQQANMIAEQVAIQLEQQMPQQQAPSEMTQPNISTEPTQQQDNTQALLLQSINLLQEQFSQMQMHMAQQG